MLLWMALLRRLPAQTESFHTFHRDGLTGHESRGRRLLVVGVGHIGHEVVRIGRGLDMEVQGVDIEPRHADVHYVSIDDGVPWADVIVCCMNLTPANAGYFDADRLRRARPGAVFVNVARGEMSPAPDLVHLLREGRLGGVALDVYNHEQELAVCLRQRRPAGTAAVRAVLELAREPRAILTPHNAFNTAEAVDRKALHSVEQVVAFLEEGAFKWTVPE
jgi:D-lactate dehydrogenase